MSLMEILDTIQIEDWVIRRRIPAGEGPFPLFVLLHGWTGDENAMWIFASRLPAGAMLLAPRGLYVSPLGGFGWHPRRPKAWPDVEDFRPASEALYTLLTSSNFPQADFSQTQLVGFSQGAALAYTMLLLDGKRIASIAALAGFLPDGASAFVRGESIAGKPVFIAHGSEDDQVPVHRARQAVEFFQDAGARVTYCEDEVGHKLSLNCFRGLEAFFKPRKR